MAHNLLCYTSINPFVLTIFHLRFQSYVLYQTGSVSAHPLIECHVAVISHFTNKLPRQKTTVTDVIFPPQYMVTPHCFNNRVKSARIPPVSWDLCQLYTILQLTGEAHIWESDQQSGFMLHVLGLHWFCICIRNNAKSLCNTFIS